jgi:hypothetical protein
VTIRLRSLLAPAAIAAACLAFGAPANADGIKIGVLTCHEGSGWGFVFGSTKSLRCAFTHDGHVEHYVGKVSKFGVDIGYTSSAVIIWDVVAPNSGVERGALAGGVGANALVGGLRRSIALQPVSIEGETGLNVAGGIGAISLKFLGDDRR